jgi:hypothetical protein
MKSTKRNIQYVIRFLISAHMIILITHVSYMHGLAYRNDWTVFWNLVNKFASYSQSLQNVAKCRVQLSYVHFVQNIRGSTFFNSSQCAWDFRRDKYR